MLDVSWNDPRSAGFANGSFTLHRNLDAALDAEAELLVMMGMERCGCVFREDGLDRQHSIAVCEGLPCDTGEWCLDRGHIVQVHYSQ